MHFYERPSTKLLQGQSMHIHTVIKDTVQTLQTERNKYVLKLDLDDDSDSTPDIIWNRVPDRRSKRKRTITKCCLTVCRSIEKRHGE